MSRFKKKSNNSDNESTNQTYLLMNGKPSCLKKAISSLKVLTLAFACLWTNLFHVLEKSYHHIPKHGAPISRFKLAYTYLVIACTIWKNMLWEDHGI